jgi:O-antigen/teichoic acid export membrane protein
MKKIPSGLVYTTALALSSGLNFLAVLVWSNTLTPAEFGSYSLVSATALLINAAAFEWLRLTTARMTADPTAPNGVHPLRANAMAALVLALLGIFAAVIVGLWLFRTPMARLSFAWWPLVGAFAVSEMLLLNINTLSRFRFLPWQFFRSIVARGVLSIVIGVILVKGFQLGATGAVLGIVVAQLATALVSIVLDSFWRTVHPFAAKIDDLAAIWRFGGPLIIGCALNYGVGVADRYVIGFLAGNAEVGLYAAPWDLVQKIVVFVMLAINLTVFPSIVREYEKNGADAARASVEQNFLLQAGLGLPAVVGFAVLAPGLSHMLLGAPFRSQAIILLPFIAVSALFRSLTTFHLNMAFQLTKRTKLMMVQPIASLAVILGAGPWALQHFGLVGMAAVTMAAQCGGFLLSLVLAQRVFRFSLLDRNLLCVLAAALAMGGALWKFRDLTHPVATLGLVAAGGAIYGGVLLALRFEPMLKVIASVRARLRRSA